MSTPPPAEPASDFLEDERLAVVVAEIESFGADAGWNQPPRLFAIVATDALLAAQPELRGTIDADAPWTPIVQDRLPDNDNLERSLATITWPEAVEGCALLQEIIVLPPDAASELPADDSASTVAAAHPERTEARLAVGVLRDQPGGACVLRLKDADADPLRGADLAPGVIQALHATFQ